MSYLSVPWMLVLVMLTIHSLATAYQHYGFFLKQINNHSISKTAHCFTLKLSTNG